MARMTTFGHNSFTREIYIIYISLVKLTVPNRAMSAIEIFKWLVWGQWLIRIQLLVAQTDRLVLNSLNPVSFQGLCFKFRNYYFFFPLKFSRILKRFSKSLKFIISSFKIGKYSKSSQNNVLHVVNPNPMFFLTISLFFNSYVKILFSNFYFWNYFLKNSIFGETT